MRSLRFLVAGLLAVAGLAAVAQQVNPLAPQPKQASGGPATAPAAAPAGVGATELTAQDLNAWLDGFVPYALASGDIAGGVVVVVRDGQVLTQRGYGFSDVERRTPVDPARTLFRPGSVSKLFTWTAVMQLVEQGRLDLDADVNTYLDFQIPEREGGPVTLRTIMTHTAGFEEQLKSLLATTPEGTPPYEDLLRRWVPERVFAAGTTPAYSNYATALAGYIVQRVSGEPFDTYIERHIFAPLGMRNSTFAQPLPARLRPMMATGYTLGSGEAVGYEFVGPRPAGSMSGTGADMAQFMIAHLNGGAVGGGGRILRPETVQAMHTTAHPGIGPLARMMLGFYETNINGRRAIGHGGDTVGFHSDLHLFLDERIGIFVSFNSTGRNGAVGGLRSAIVDEFADRYLPAPRDTRRVPAETAAEHARMMAGTWFVSRGAFSSFMNILELASQSKVSVGADGELIAPIMPGLNGQPRQWVEVEPFVWQDLNSHERLAATVVDGQVVRFSQDTLSPFMVYDRVPWHKDSAWLLPALIAALLILLVTALFWPIRALVRRRFSGALALEKKELLSYRLVRGASWLIVLVLVGWMTALTMMMGDFNNLSSGFDPIILVLQVLSFIAFLGGLAVILWDAWLVWRGKRGWKSKVWSLALVFAAVIVVWIGFAFNLLSLGTNY